MRMNRDGPSWNGEDQSRPKLGEECMDKHVDICVGLMVKVEVAYDIEVIGYVPAWVVRMSCSSSCSWS